MVSGVGYEKCFEANYNPEFNGFNALSFVFGGSPL